MDAVDRMVNKKHAWKNPYGKPESAKKIIKILESHRDEILSPKVWWNHPKIEKNLSISEYQKSWKNKLLPDNTLD